MRDPSARGGGGAREFSIKIRLVGGMRNIGEVSTSIEARKCSRGRIPRAHKSSLRNAGIGEVLKVCLSVTMASQIFQSTNDGRVTEESAEEEAPTGLMV